MSLTLKSLYISISSLKEWNKQEDHSHLKGDYS